MVRTAALLDRFRYEDGFLYWKNGPRSGKKVGFRRNDGYLQVNFLCDGKRVRMLAHKIIYQMHHDTLPDLVDHIDRDPTNDRIENLRASNKSQNALNTNPRSNNKTGVKGVHKMYTGKFEASVWDGSKKVYLGLHNTVSEASSVIDKWKLDNDL